LAAAGSPLGYPPWASAVSITFTAPEPAPRNRRRAFVLLFVAVLGLAGLGAYAVTTRHGKAATGDLYFTTFTHQALYRTSIQFANGRPQFGAQSIVAHLPAADGVTFEPDGKAVVGGQLTGNVEEIDTATGAVSQVPSGCAAAFLVALSPSGRTVYSGGLPGQLCAVPTDPLRAGAQVPLHGDDTLLTDVAFDEFGEAFYTTEVTGGGNFGILDLASNSTTRLITRLQAAHGIAFDPFSKTLLLFGGESIVQVDPRNPKTILSSMTVSGAQFDTGTADGLGHLYVASNTGQLVVVDYHSTLRLGDQRDVVTRVDLHSDLDDIAPLVGPGAAGTRARSWIPEAAGALGGLLLLSLAYLFLPRPQLVSALPTWDIRRQELDRRRRRDAARRREAAPGRPGRPARKPRPGRGW
jgi:sugar lactone lactonase YvrE